MTAAEAALETVVRGEWGRLTSLLLAQFRRLDLVEDALGDGIEVRPVVVAESRPQADA